MDRAITPDEGDVIQWLLEHAATPRGEPYRTLAVEDLRVVKGCDCGCASLDFQPNAWGGARIIADAVAKYEDGQEAGLILWARDEQIVLLEIYDFHPGSSRRFPRIADLCRWEDRGKHL
jgi:hypothetical protein